MMVFGHEVFQVDRDRSDLTGSRTAAEVAALKKCGIDKPLPIPSPAALAGQLPVGNRS
jgi:hypothetical protein